MPWTRLDDTFYGNPKILDLFHEAFRLYVVSLNWAVAQMTDGRVPWVALSICLPDETPEQREESAGQLVKVGLWTVNGTGWLIHDFLEYQETRETIEDRRERWAESKRKQRDKSEPESSPRSQDMSARTPKGHVSQSPRLPSHPIPSTEAKASTEREGLFKAFFEFWTGRKYKPGQKMPAIERGRINKAVGEAVEAGITEAEVRARGKVYKEKWRDLEVSPQALLANWSKFDRSKPDEEPPCPICDSRRIVGVTVEGEIVKADDPRAVGSDRCRCVTR
jgi:hypothetical protein